MGLLLFRVAKRNTAQKLISRQKPGMAVPKQQYTTLQDGSLCRNYGEKIYLGASRHRL